jgi:1,2-dihydroxy-3-keto-5-methylthiopentene dioxygenase
VYVYNPLTDIGVLHWEGMNGVDDPRLAAIREERGYTYMDMIECCPEKLPGYDTKILSFFEEHIHRDEEIRFCADGSGYFDVRDENDKWIRVHLGAGDLIILPAGIMHRYTNDTNNYIKAVRLFVGEPVWTPYNRTDIAADDDSVVKYRSQFIEKNKRVKLSEDESASPAAAAPAVE